ncbi:Structural maintenance of chromosomes protein 3 [Cyanidiococcus yangmingshanensis]|uniref:Structural maintenance of chromosomes protein 3 n=1 Tax=Cyanidiococcus yangmingshanensis TaxID=2690220 RepID=A0A7J7IKJ5_9RHOD|nr:Structural maintenance of chromosomes protein 3 [Cyanidiococcus yangmingshanensis]
MTGGQSRLASLLRVDHLRAQMYELESDRQNIRAQLAERESQIHRAMSELQKTEAEKRTFAKTVRELQEKLALLAREQESVEAALDAQRQQMQTLQRHVCEYETVLRGLREELAGMSATGSSSRTEDVSVDMITNRLAALQEELETVATERAKLEQRLVEIESELGTFIERQMRELERRLLREAFDDVPELAPLDADTGDVSDSITHSEAGRVSIVDLQARQAAVSSELESARSAVHAHHESLERIALALQRKESELEEQTRKRDALEAQLPGLREELASESQRLKVRFARRTQLLQRKTETERKLRELGPAPAQFQELTQEPNHRLMQRLQEANTRFSQLGQVNQKALEQYLSFANQREELIARQSELERGDHSIRTLIETLDRRRANDMQRTFKGIARLFADVFRELVPGGIGQLIMLRGPAVADPSANPDFIGVAIRAQFPSENRFCTLTELSGGQKTMVALALVLAIQRLDPAPFYLFDEIDASLDAASRERIATLLLQQQQQHQASGSNERDAPAGRAETRPQLIVTTFRPELVRVADRCYGVTVRDRVSRVEPITPAEALAFVTENDPIDASRATSGSNMVALSAPPLTTNEAVTAPLAPPVVTTPDVLQRSDHFTMVAMEQGGGAAP